MISLTIAISSFGLMMIYFILFADISRSLTEQIFFDDQKTDNFFASKAFFIFVLAALMFPLVIKKEL